MAVNTGYQNRSNFSGPVFDTILFVSIGSYQGCGVRVGGVACFQLESESGVGVGFQNCWSRSQESVFQNWWSRSQESEHLFQLPTPMFIK